MIDEPTVLRSRTGADFLATLPTLAGFTASDSLMLVPFRGKRTRGGVARMDLDAFRGTEDHTAAAADLAGLLRRIEGCDAAAIVVMANESFPVARLVWESLWTALEDAFHALRLETKDALIQTPDGWGSFYDPDLPPEGRPLTEIEQSPLLAQAEEVRAGEPLRPSNADWTLPEPEAAFTAALRDAVMLLIDFGTVSDAFGRLRRAESLDPIPVVEAVLTRKDAETVTIPEMARLIAVLANPATRDQSLIQVAFGVKASRAVARDHARLHDIQARTGRSMDTIVRREMRTGRRSFTDLDGAMLGDTTRMPDRTRMDRAIAVLRRAIPAIEPIDRGGPLCVLAWLHWAMGAENAAVARIADAARVAPHLTMVPLMQQIVHELSPKWLYRRP